MVQISNSVDTASIVSQLMAVERIPQSQLQTRVGALQSKQSAWSQIGSKVTALQTAAEALAPMGAVGNLMTATSSNDAAVGVRVTGVASPTNATIEITRLATTHAVVSTDTFTDAAASVGGRTMTSLRASANPTFIAAAAVTWGLSTRRTGGPIEATMSRVPSTEPPSTTRTSSISE